MVRMIVVITVISEMKIAVNVIIFNMLRVKSMTDKITINALSAWVTQVSDQISHMYLVQLFSFSNVFLNQVN